LRRQGRPPLAISRPALLGQLAEDGKLLDRHGRPIRPGQGGPRVRQVRFEGGTRPFVFAVPLSEFINGPGPFVPEPDDREDGEGDAGGGQVEGRATDTAIGPDGRVATPGPGGATRSRRQCPRPPV
jgi:hypothetical protein